MTDAPTYRTPKTQKATIARAVKREKQKHAALMRSRGRALQKAASGQASPNLDAFFYEVNARHRDRLQEHGARWEILSNMLSNISVPESRRRYTVPVLLFSMVLASLSYVSYNYMRGFLVLPSYSWLSRFFKNDLQQARETLTCIDKIPFSIDSFLARLNTSEKNALMRYGGFLAVDAISVKPHIFVRRDGIVEGLVKEEKLNNSEFGDLQTLYQRYEDYVKSLRNKTISDTFVYQYQPLVSGIKCLPLFFEASTQGKASGHEIDRLAQITRQLQDKGLAVEGVAFDGDSTYQQLHRIFFDSYADTVASDIDFKNFSLIAEQSVACDPLHLLKRARYRLLSSRVHANFENTTQGQINISLLMLQLNLPSVVFSNEKYTKMHDGVAVRLFSMETLTSLLQMRNYTSLSYFLPLCLLCASLHEQNLTVNQRYNFLEVAFYYMLGYYRMLTTSRTPLRQYKLRGEEHVVAFDAVFARQFCNTVCSLLKVLSRVNATVALNRVGSNPVEHLFGLIRMRSRNVHTYQKMLRVMSKTTLQTKFLHELGERRIEHRLSYFAQNVHTDPSCLRNTIGAEPRDLAFILHCIFGLPITARDLMVWDVLSIHDLRDDLFENFRSTVLAIASRCNSTSSVRLTSTDISVSTGSSIIGRLAAKTVIS